MEVCEKNNCDSSASKQSCDASVKRMNRGSISELLQCDFKICFSLNPFAVIFAFFPELGWLYLSLSFELNWCECWKLTVGLCVERPDGECASRQRSEVTDSCFLAELRWRRGHGAAANTHTHTHTRWIRNKSKKYPVHCSCFVKLSHFTMYFYWIWNTHAWCSISTKHFNQFRMKCK